MEADAYASQATGALGDDRDPSHRSEPWQRSALTVLRAVRRPFRSAGLSTQEDLEELRVAWINERFAPELLPHRDELVKRLRVAIDEQQERIAELGPQEALKRHIYETEVERVAFMLRSFLRTRIQKIQKQSLHLARDAEAKSHLSSNELEFAGKYAGLFQQQIDREAWAVGETDRLPETLKQITNISQLANPPNLDAHVFCQATRDCPPLTLDGTTDVVELNRGEIALLPYAPLRRLLDEGAVVLA